MPGIGETNFGEQAAAVEVCQRLLSGKQSGPKSGTRERNYVAHLLAEAALTLRLVEEHRDEFAKIVGGEP